MSQELISRIQKKYINKTVPVIKPGSTVEIETIIRDGDKQRIQKFKGLVIAVNGSGLTTTITVRKVSYGIGVEKKFPLYSTNIGKIKVLKEEKVRRAKLYFMRERVGKSALRVKRGKAVIIPQEGKEVTDTEIIESQIENNQE